MTAFLDALRSAKQEDLEAIEARIATLQIELQLLTDARTILDKRLRSQPDAGKRQGAASKAEAAAAEPLEPIQSLGGQEYKLADAIYALISQEGSLPPDVIAARLGRSTHAIAIAVGKSGWFHRSKEGDVEIAMTK